MQKEYRVGVIGQTGRGNYGHAVDRVWLEINGCRIVAVADSDPNGLAAAAKRLRAPKGFADYRKMLDDTKPDIVSICPRWIDQHHAMVCAAVDRGIHVYVEKPFCRTLEEADDIVKRCEAGNVKLAISYQTRYSPKLETIRQLIESGKIGTLLELRGRGKEDHRGGGEDLWVLGSHIMNLIHYFAGEPRWCFARVLQDGHPVARADVAEGNEGIGPLAGDMVDAMYGMDSGVIAYFASHRNTNGGRFGLQLFGSKGVIEVRTGHLPDVYYLDDPTWSTGRGGGRWLPVSSQGVNRPEVYTSEGLISGNILACQDLIGAIEEDRLPEANVYEARIAVEMIAGVFESHRLNRPVQIPLKTRKNPLTLL